jgi:hypothetical protein
MVEILFQNHHIHTSLENKFKSSGWTSCLYMQVYHHCIEQLSSMGFEGATSISQKAEIFQNVIGQVFGEEYVKNKEDGVLYSTQRAKRLGSFYDIKRSGRKKGAIYPYTLVSSNDIIQGSKQFLASYESGEMKTNVMQRDTLIPQTSVNKILNDLGIWNKATGEWDELSMICFSSAYKVAASIKDSAPRDLSYTQYVPLILLARSIAWRSDLEFIDTGKDETKCKKCMTAVPKIVEVLRGQMTIKDFERSTAFELRPYGDLVTLSESGIQYFLNPSTLKQGICKNIYNGRSNIAWAIIWNNATSFTFQKDVSNVPKKHFAEGSFHIAQLYIAKHITSYDNKTGKSVNPRQTRSEFAAAVEQAHISFQHEVKSMVNCESNEHLFSAGDVQGDQGNEDIVELSDTENNSVQSEFNIDAYKLDVDPSCFKLADMRNLDVWQPHFEWS